MKVDFLETGTKEVTNRKQRLKIEVEFFKSNSCSSVKNKQELELTKFH